MFVDLHYNNQLIQSRISRNLPWSVDGQKIESAHWKFWSVWAGGVGDQPESTFSVNILTFFLYSHRLFYIVLHSNLKIPSFFPLWITTLQAPHTS